MPARSFVVRLFCGDVSLLHGDVQKMPSDADPSDAAEREDAMSTVSLQSRTLHLAATLTTGVVALAIALSLAAPAFAAPTLLRLSTDPYTNTTSQHQTEVEPDTL